MDISKGTESGWVWFSGRAPALRSRPGTENKNKTTAEIVIKEVEARSF
jgi:hypothetical protein